MTTPEPKGESDASGQNEAAFVEWMRELIDEPYMMDSYLVTEGQIERLFANARRGALIEGATEAWVLMSHRDVSHIVLVDEERAPLDQLANEHALNGIDSTVHRVLVLRAEP